MRTETPELIRYIRIERNETTSTREFFKNLRRGTVLKLVMKLCTVYSGSPTVTLTDIDKNETYEITAGRLSELFRSGRIQYVYLDGDEAYFDQSINTKEAIDENQHHQ